MRKIVMIAIEGKNIYYGYNEQPVIKNVSFSIPSNTITAIIGPNGVGKTTLLKIMAFLLKPQKGSLKIFNRNTPLPKWIYYQSQSFNKKNELFVATSKEVIISLNKNSNENIFNIAKYLKIEKLLNKNFQELSVGEQQKVLLARAIYSNAKILLLDEPSSSVDFDSLKSYYKTLKDLTKKGRTIVVTTHDFMFIQKYVDNIICMGEDIFTSCSIKEFDYGVLENIYKSFNIIKHRHDRNDR